jgi:hypothetical protein
MTTAAALTYDGLVEQVQIYAERSDEPFVSSIPFFIMMAENRICSGLRGLGLKKFVSGTLIAGQTTLDKPVRWRETSSFSIIANGSRKYVYERGYEYCRTYWPDATILGEPEYYANYDYEHLFIAPTPDAAYAFEFSYYERPQPLDSITQTNFLTQYYPQLLLYGTLLEAQPFLKLPERIQEFKTFYDEAVKNFETESQRRAIDSSNLRTEA